MIRLAFILALLASPLAAQNTNCAPRDKAVSMLTEKYGEARQSIAIDGRGRMVEVYANSETGSWTALVTTANGLSCIASSGQGFELVKAVEPSTDL